MLKDTPNNDFKALPQSSKITFNLVPFQNYLYPDTQIKNSLPQYPTHSPRVQGGLCIPWGQGVPGAPARGAGDIAELRKRQQENSQPQYTFQIHLSTPNPHSTALYSPQPPSQPQTNPDLTLPHIYSNLPFQPLLKSSLALPSPTSPPALLTRACCRIAWA